MKIIYKYDRAKRKAIFEHYNFRCAKCGKHYFYGFLKLCLLPDYEELLPLCDDCIVSIEIKEKAELQAKKLKKLYYSPVKNKRLYNIWRNMLTRCNNVNNPNYKNYGNRDIKVCEEWEKSFVKFCEWAKSAGYDETAKRGQCTIDRINNNKGYYPNNCRWVDMKIQCNNRRKKATKNNETVLPIL